jgi:arylformamidase
MKIHDVTLTIHERMPVWPGDPSVDLHRISKIEEGANANVSFLALGVHTGTHVDAPYHFLMEGKYVDALLLDILIGPTTVVGIDSSINEINESVVKALNLKPGITRILFKTRNSAFWQENNAEFQPGFVGISEDGALELVKRGIKLVGIDYLSIAPYKRSRPTHEVLLKAELVVIEGLNLSQVIPGEYNLYCLPLKLAHTDGAPARVVLIEE